jgi:hypothetical protein
MVDDNHLRPILDSLKPLDEVVGTDCGFIQELGSERAPNKILACGTSGVRRIEGAGRGLDKSGLLILTYSTSEKSIEETQRSNFLTKIWRRNRECLGFY